jgi:RHS repeat-associated protein
LIHARVGTQQIYLANVDTVPVAPAKPTADLVIIGTAATSGAATVIVRASNGTLFGANTTWSTDSIVGTNGVADMNNDGRADLVTSPGTPNNIYVRLSSGTTFAAGAGTSWGAATGINMRAVDVTGDGKADLVDPTTTTVRIAGTGTFSAATAWAATSLNGPQGAIFGNIDGTGGNDVIGGSNTTNIQVRLSNNTTAFVAGNGFCEPFSFATKRYYMAGTVAVAVIDQANIGYHWLASDTQGTTSLDVPDASGTAGITYQRYKPYGQQRGGDTITTTDHGFLGQIEDTTGLTYLNNRYLDPALGRFVSVDPLVNITRDAYGYVNNNPIAYSDPSGLKPCDDPRNCGRNGGQSSSADASGSGSNVETHRAGVSATPGLYAADLISREIAKNRQDKIVKASRYNNNVQNDISTYFLHLALLGKKFAENGIWDHKPTIKFAAGLAGNSDARDYLDLGNGYEVQLDVFSNIHYGYIMKYGGFGDEESIEYSHSNIGNVVRALDAVDDALFSIVNLPNAGDQSDIDPLNRARDDASIRIGIMLCNCADGRPTAPSTNAIILAIVNDAALQQSQGVRPKR